MVQPGLESCKIEKDKLSGQDRNKEPKCSAKGPGTGLIETGKMEKRGRRGEGSIINHVWLLGPGSAQAPGIGEGHSLFS